MFRKRPSELADDVSSRSLRSVPGRRLALVGPDADGCILYDPRPLSVVSDDSRERDLVLAESVDERCDMLASPVGMTRQAYVSYRISYNKHACCIGSAFSALTACIVVMVM